MSDEDIKIPEPDDSAAQATLLIKHAKRIQSIELKHAVQKYVTREGFYVCSPVIRIQTDIFAMEYINNFFTFHLNPANDQSMWQFNFPGKMKYNELLSVIEDIINMPIEEFTFGAFHYLDESML